MLVLSRKEREAIVIGENVVVRVVSIHGSRVRLSIEAPPEITIDREEVRRRIEAQRVVAPADSTREVLPETGTSQQLAP